MRLTHSMLGLSFTLTMLGCARPPTIKPQSTSSVSSEREREPGVDPVSISGLRGTLSQEEIRGALEPRLPRFLRCAASRLGELEVLSGSLSLAFHVAVNGSVAAVSPGQSSLGDRVTERCMLEVAESTRFPAPHGGEADFTWPLELPLDSEVRAPVELPPDFALPVRTARVEGLEQASALQGACGGRSYVVTAYLAPDGHVLASGVASPDPATPNDLDCIAQGTLAWIFPSPGSYVGKLSFSVP